MNKFIVCTLVVLAFLSSVYVAQATTYDVAADFSATTNPNGAWSYGESSTLTSALTLYPNSGKFDPPTINIDVWAGENHPYTPNVSHNGTGSVDTSHPTIIWQIGQFSLHPGDNVEYDEYSHARWTAPSAGSIDIDAMLTGIDFGSGPHLGTTTDVHILHYNGIWNILFDGEVDECYGDTSSFSTTVSVGMGDIIDFAVGYGSDQNNTCDTTALSATIDFIPEPATLGLLILGGLALLGRDKKKA